MQEKPCVTPLVMIDAIGVGPVILNAQAVAAIVVAEFAFRGFGD